MLTPRAFKTLPRFREIDFYLLTGKVFLSELFKLLKEKHEKSKSLIDFLKGLHEAEQAFFILWAVENKIEIAQIHDFYTDALTFSSIELQMPVQEKFQILETAIRENPSLFCHPGGGRQFVPNFTGIVKSYYSENEIHETLEVVNGKAEGHYLERNKNGNIIQSILFENGKKIQAKEFTEFFEIDIEFNFENGELIENRTYKNANNQIVKTEQRNEFKELHGRYEEIYAHGQLKLSKTFVQGKEEGEWLSFYENGQTHKSGFYKTGILYLINSYSENGKTLLSEGNGILEEIQKNSAGDQLRYESNYENGLKHGVQKIYKNGVLETENQFILGELQKDKKKKKNKNFKYASR